MRNANLDQDPTTQKWWNVLITVMFLIQLEVVGKKYIYKIEYCKNLPREGRGLGLPHPYITEHLIKHRSVDNVFCTWLKVKECWYRRTESYVGLYKYVTLINGQNVLLLGFEIRKRQRGEAWQCFWCAGLPQGRSRDQISTSYREGPLRWATAMRINIEVLHILK